MVELRQAAKLQGLDSVKVWACNQGCYDNSLIEQGGADVEGTYSVLTTLPFFTEYKSNSSLRSLVQQVGGVDKTFTNTVCILRRGTALPGRPERPSRMAAH